MFRRNDLDRNANGPDFLLVQERRVRRSDAIHKGTAAAGLGTELEDGPPAVTVADGTDPAVTSTEKLGKGLDLGHPDSLGVARHELGKVQLCPLSRVIDDIGRENLAAEALMGS